MLTDPNGIETNSKQMPCICPDRFAMVARASHRFLSVQGYSTGTASVAYGSGRLWSAGFYFRYDGSYDYSIYQYGWTGQLMYFNRKSRNIPGPCSNKFVARHGCD